MISKNLKTLIQMFLYNGAGYSSKGDNEKKKKKNKVVFGFLLFVYIPICIMFGLLAYYLTAIKPCDVIQMNILLLGMCMAGAVMLFFGLMMIPSIFYFSDDIKYLLPMPIAGHEIAHAKLISTWVWENITAASVFLPFMIGTFIAYPKNGFTFWIFGIVALFTLSIIPTLIGIIVNVLLIRFTPFGYNRKLLSYANSFISIFVCMSISVLIVNSIFSDSIEFLVTIVTNNNIFSQAANIIMPHLQYAARFMVYGEWSNIVWYVAWIIIFLVIYNFLIKKCYISGLLKLSNDRKKKKIDNKYLLRKTKKRTPLLAFIKKEFITLFNNSSFFISCISCNLIIPIILLFINGGPFHSFLIDILNSLSKSYYDKIMLIVLIIIAIIPAGMNYIAATSMSREGSDMYAIKYYPITYNAFIESKYIVAFLISFISYLLSIIALLLLGITFSLSTFLLGTFCGGSCVLFLIALGVFIDLYNPTLIWTEEEKAVKENFNGIIVLIVAVLLCLFFGFACFHSFLINYFFIISIVMLLLATILFFLTESKARKIINKY